MSDFDHWKEDLRNTPDYKATGIAIDFIVACERRREQLSLSYADVARKLGVTRPRVNQLFSGECNMTLKTMQELADVLGLSIKLITMAEQQLDLSSESAIQGGSTSCQKILK